MKIKYRDNTLKPNNSIYCIDCDIYDYIKPDITCFGLCYKVKSVEGFSMTNNCEVLEL